MKLCLYAIKDDLTGFKSISMEDNDPCALRNFSYAVTSNEIVKLNAKNYSLYKLGIYDTETGIIDSSMPELIVTADSITRGLVNGEN